MESIQQQIGAPTAPFTLPEVPTSVVSTGLAAEQRPSETSPTNIESKSAPAPSSDVKPFTRFKHGLKKFIRPQQDTTIDLSFIMLSVVIYGVFVFAMGSDFLPGHAAWCTLLMWACSVIGALIANQLYLPRVIGMLVAGLLLQNIPWSAIDAFPKKWGTQMRAAALATIFLRCGLELDFGTMRKYKHQAIRLSLLPGLAEALFDAGLAVALFGMNYELGLCMGFILKAVGPGLVVPAMFRLQRAKVGTDQGIPSTVVISASFDDIVAITGYAIFSTIAIAPYNSGDGTSNENNVAWSIASGPLQVVFGIVGGFLAGTTVGATKLWNTQSKRFFALLGSGFLLMFFLEYYNLLSGGALGALFTGLVASNFWERGVPRVASLGPSFVYSPECEKWMSLLWRWIMEPILFVTVGATLDFSKLSKGTIPRSLCIVLCGVTLRMIVTYVAMSGFGYTSREKVFYALAWTPKATVQAALSAAPLAMIDDFKKGAPDYEQWVEWGNDILTTGLFAIILCGTLGVLAIHFSAPVTLKAGKYEDEAGENTGTEAVVGQIGAGSRDQDFALKTKGFATVAALKIADKAGQELNSPRSGGSYQTPVPQFGALIAGEDLSLVAEYIDAIHHLTAAVADEGSQYTPNDVLRLSQRVQQLQQHIESEVGNREPSVRELFRTASFMRGRRFTSGSGRSRSQGAGSRSADKGGPTSSSVVHLLGYQNTYGDDIV